MAEEFRQLTAADGVAYGNLVVNGYAANDQYGFAFAARHLTLDEAIDWVKSPAATARATSAAVLDELKGQHVVVDLLLEYRDPNTPVIIGRDVAGPNESVRVVRLADLKPAVVAVVADAMRRLAKVAQGHARQFLHRHAGLVAARQYARQETFQVRADPVQQVDVRDPPHIGRAQGEVMRRGARWQQHLGLSGITLNGGGDQLQRLDAGQHAHFGAGGEGGETEQEQNEEARHGTTLGG